MKLKTAIRLYWTLMILGFILIIIGVYLVDSFTILAIGGILPVIAVFFVDRFIKCPKCGAYLVHKYGLPEKCPRCEEDITKAMEEQ